MDHLLYLYFFFILVKLQEMQQDYINLFTKFYEKMTQKHQQSQLLKRTLERYLNYQLKEEQKLVKQKQKDGSDYKSFKSASSNTSLSSFEKVKKLFYSNNLEIAVLFYYFLKKLQNRDCANITKILSKISEKLKKIDKGLPSQQKKRFSTKLSKFVENSQFLEQKVSEGKPIEWLYFQVFKQFEQEAALAAQVISSQGQTLESKEALKASEFSQFLRALKAEVYIFNYVTRQTKVIGFEGERLFLGRRSDTFFVLTEKQYEKISGGGISVSRKNVANEIVEEKEKKIKQLKKYSTNKFKEQFLSEMLKLRQGYEANTAIIASLFNFKDANDAPKTTDQVIQA